MKGIEIARKIFVTFASILLIGAFVAAIYFGLMKDEATGLAVIAAFGSSIFVYIVGVVLAEAKTSGAHRVGIGLHLASVVLSSINIAIYFMKFMAGIAEKLNGGSNPLEWATVPLFVALGGIFFYFFSYIFAAASASKAHKLEEEKARQEQYAFEQQAYQEPVYEAPVEEPAPAPVEEPAPVEQPVPQPAPAPVAPVPAPYPPYYGYAPAPAPVQVYAGQQPSCCCHHDDCCKEEPKEESLSKEELMEAVKAVVREELAQVEEKIKAEESARADADKANSAAVEAVRAENSEPSPMPEDDVHVAAMMKWKKLYLEGIITEREFIRKRDEILHLGR